MRVHIENIGCFKNLVDSERLLFAIEQMGINVSFGQFHGFADIAIINTCGFIQDAETGSVALIRQYEMLKMQGMISQLWVMGCYGQKMGERLKAEVPEVDSVFGNFDWDDILIRLGHISMKDIGVWRHITTPSHYAYLKISEGCSRPCSYCIKPILNGPLKSISMERLIEEVKWLVKQGVCELQLVAQNLTDYGIDLYGEKKIAELVERISDIPGVEWIRLHYTYPIGFPSRLLDVIRERNNVCKYLDMALQHCNPEILRLMRRSMSKEELVSLLSEIRNAVPGIYLRTTFMVGFPGETDEMFDELCTFVKNQKFERMGVFRYSAQTGSYSYKNYNDTVPESVKTLRALTLMNIQNEKYHLLNTSLVGTVQKVIVDSFCNGEYHCRTEHSTPMADPKIITDSKYPLKIGSFQMVRITESIGKDMRGIIYNIKVMNIFVENNISLLVKPNTQKIIVYLPFAKYATTVDLEDIFCLESALKNEGKDYPQLNAILKRIIENKPHLYKTPRTVDGMRSLMLLPNNKCNFHCSYCYSAKGRTNSEISPNILKAGLAYFLNPQRGKDERLSISVLGGGEPLLSWNILKPALEYAFAVSKQRVVSCPISLVTNGSICTDEIVSFCVDNNISLSISFDILPDVQNKQRGHWKIVSENINRFAEAGIDVALNTVISNENVIRMTEMIEHLHICNPKVKKVSFKILISKGYFQNIEERIFYYKSFISHFFEAKKEADKYGIWLTCSYMNTCITLTDRYCHGKFVITSEGDISSCHTVGSKYDELYDKFIFGHIDGQTGQVVIDNDKLTAILSHDVYKNSVCENCPARWHCAGGCYADHFHLNKEEHEAYCESMRLFLANYLTYKYKL